LDYDPLVDVSLSTPAVFQGYLGTITGGLGSAAIVVPANPALTGVVFYTAFVTLDSGAPSGIAGISNTLRIGL
jgi:hypothetical protein